MENGTATLEITTAITDDDLDVVKSWLGSGGDPNAMCSGSHEWSLLRWAASYGKPEIMSLLLSRGADVDATDPEGRTAVYQLLNHWGQHRSLPALRVLLSHGADVNLAKTARTLFAGRSPLMNATSVEGPDIIRLLLRAGADPEHRAPGYDGYTAEEVYREQTSSRRMFGEGAYAERCADLLRDVRWAGGWVRYALQPHYDLLVLRALCHRGRATYDARTPEALVRLFGAPDGRRRTRSARARVGVRVHLPDPLFWRVLEFALGAVYDYPWVRERVRARAAAHRRG